MTVIQKHLNPVSPCGACCTQFKKLTVSLDGLNILENISLHLHCGEMTAIIGPNGAGKTTLFKALLGQIPYSGEITFSDSEGLRTGTPRIGYVPQHLSVEPMAPITVLDFMCAAIFRRPVMDIISERFANSLALMARPDAQVGIVTNNYHLWRALRLARRAGMVNAHGIASEYTGPTLIHFMFREAVSITVSFLKGYL